MGLGVGIGGLVAGAAMILFGGPKAEPKAAFVLVDTLPGGAMMSYRASF